jgi:hypothetical protein
MSIENGHPYRCLGCGTDYRTARFAAKCCRVACISLLTAERTVFCEEREERALAEDIARLERELAAAHYECSCGERFENPLAAFRCRKCRVYTTEGYCTEVTDLNTGETWSRSDIEVTMGIVSSALQAGVVA